MKLFNRSFHYALGILALAVGTLLPSCTQESFIESQDDEGIEMVIHVGDETRTTNNGTSTLWEDDDALTVIHAAPGGSEFWASRFTKNSGENSFTGKVKRLSAANDWYVVYPYQEDNVAADQLSFSFPASQNQAGNASMAHLAGPSFPLVAKYLNLDRSSQLNVTMENVLHVLEFDFENKTESGHSVKVKEVQFTATSPIAGVFNVDLTGDDPVLTAESGATKVVKLGVTDGDSISAGGTSKFYMAIAPFTAPAGSKLKVKVTALDTVTEETIVFYRIITAGDNGIIFSSGTIQPIGVEFDEKNSQDPDAGSGTEVELPIGGEPENGTYLLVYENGENSYAFAAFDEYKSQNYRIPVVVENGVVLPQDGIDLSRFAVELENTGEEHPNDAGHDAYNVRNSEGKYVFYATAGGTYEAADALHILDNNEMEVQGSMYKYYHTFEQTEDGVRIVCSIATSGNFYLLSYTSANGFNYQQDNAAGTNLHLFRIGGGSAKERQELVFSETSVTYDFTVNGEGPLTNKPTLTGSHTELSWESNNTDVATVDENGDVTIHGPGYATITVTAAADDTYYEASLSYTIESRSSDVQTWYKAEEIEAGKQYLVVSNGYALQNDNGSLAATSVNVNNDVITLMGSAPTSIIWTANASNQLANNNTQYLGTITSGQSWNPTYSLSIGNASSAQAWTYDADSNKLTFSVSSFMGSSTYYLHYDSSSNAFAIGTSQSVAALYSTTKPLTKQTLTFDENPVRWIVGDGEQYQLHQNYPVQVVKGASTTVTYTSSDPDIASISGTTITLNSLGNVTITATAKEENGFKGATATYRLYIKEPVSGDVIKLEGSPFNLENDMVHDYLDEADDKYTDTNYKKVGSTASVSVVADYSKYASNDNRLDIPKPVPVEWGFPSTGKATITVYKDELMTEEEWQWETTTTEATSFDVYNLVPGKKYWCTVEDESGATLLQCWFETKGRRRMMKVSDEPSQNNVNNCRDLGGLKTTNGKRIKYGMIFRGTNPSGLSTTEKEYMLNYMNIGLDNDLREANQTNVFSSYDWVAYHNPGYSFSFDNSNLYNANKVKETMQAFIDCAISGKASYFHCAIGSDRTGYFGLMVEGLLGVSPKDCSIDYEMTSFAKNVTGGNRERNSTSTFKAFTEGMSYLYDQQEGDTLQDKIINYLTSKAVGISEDDITAFLNAVLEDDPDLQ